MRQSIRLIRSVAPTARGALPLLVAVLLAAAAAADTCPFTCGDLDGDTQVALPDVDTLLLCLGESPATPPCLCADLDGSGTIDLADVALLAVVFGRFSDEWPPDCTGAPGATANLTAYRPQHGAGYAPFARTPVAEADEDDPTLGPGIRRNAPGDTDPSGEDDLIEVVLMVDPPGARLALRRDHPALRVWTTRGRLPGTELPFTGNETGMLPLAPAQTTLTVWVEWAAPVHGLATLQVVPPGGPAVKDALVFHTFESIVVALGGENQIPGDPPDPNNGTFAVAVDLYRQGYDVHMYDEDQVAADGTGAVFDEVARAIAQRGVTRVAIFGYSHGGGSTRDLAALLDLSRASLGAFEIRFTSYVDAVGNSSDIDMSQELRRPPGTLYHLNQYQHGSFFEDFGLDGGPVPGSHPPPTGLDVETTPWGAHATHFQIDDFVEVRDLIKASLEPSVPRDLPAAGGFPRPHPASAPPRPAVPAVGPDPALQAAIARVLDAADERARLDALDALAALDPAGQDQLVRDLVYFSAHAADTRGAMAAGAILRRLGLSDTALLRAVLPLLEDADPAVRHFAGSILGRIEGRAPGRRPDFAPYREPLAEFLAAGDQPPPGLVRYLYESDPGGALLVLTRAAEWHDPADLRPLVWAEHVVGDALWRQRNGFADPAQADPAALAELTRLAGHRAWWVRLFVAETLRQAPAFRRPELVTALGRDPHELVRAAASFGG